MCSAQVHPEDIQGIPLACEQVKNYGDMFLIKGKLHCEDVYHIENTGKDNPNFRMEYDSGRILDLEIDGDIVEIGIQWTNYPPKEKVEFINEYSYTKIKAKKIWWENIPDLHDLFA